MTTNKSIELKRHNYLVHSQVMFSGVTFVVCQKVFSNKSVCVCACACACACACVC